MRTQEHARARLVALTSASVSLRMRGRVRVGDKVRVGPRRTCASIIARIGTNIAKWTSQHSNP
eukprot:6214115-Pleurochrysis_carterae.AAC.2